jgi:hypothetical protein
LNLCSRISLRSIRATCFMAKVDHIMAGGL